MGMVLQVGRHFCYFKSVLPTVTYYTMSRERDKKYAVFKAGTVVLENWQNE